MTTSHNAVAGFKQMQQYTQQLHQLLPPGKVWEWPRNGIGDCLLQALAEEFVRVHQAIDTIAGEARDAHRVAAANFSLPAYRYKLLSWGYHGQVNDHQQPPLRVGARVGARCYHTDWQYVITITLELGQDHAKLLQLLENDKQSHVRVLIRED